ncbi:TLD-domain-containing protein [Parachaetomium inaequale]|uniref:Restriction of telomere capping protein 5 n=1 Tax=Parachaetomium inaequale TaxID=2588326 RepID=A0AAN6SQS8_9PEZI|nr:TLD-domain-containing protein [Parachaetomium inaequale]
MGQTQSNEKSAPPPHEELTKELAGKFAEKCFTPLELYSLKDVFNSLADHEHQVRYLKEGTIARFLEVPDVLGVTAVLFQMVSYLGAFPFLQDAPAVLGLEQMVMVVTILTERYRRVLARGALSRRKLLFGSLAVYDRKLSTKGACQDGNAAPVAAPPSGFAVDEPGDDEDPGLDDDDELVLAAFDSLDYLTAFRHQGLPAPHGAMIPADNMRKLIMLLLLVAPLDAQDSLSSYSSRLSSGELESLRETADCVLAAFLNHTSDQRQPANLPSEQVQPLLEDTGSIMHLNILSQLSFFLPGPSLFRRLRLLYSGDEDGFSMGSFESKVFNWRAPTILLVSGTRLPDETNHAHSGPASAFLATLPSQRFPQGDRGEDKNERLTFGAYLSQPWKHTHRDCFGDEDTILFQLQPVHDVFRASTVNKDYTSFTKPSASAPLGGISFGCPPPQPTQAFRRSNIMSLGPVSLALEDSFEFGCFTHDYSSQGGAFQASAARKFDFQDRFEISSIEVWGCGGDEEAKHQAERWAWEAREAEARRKINLGTGDIEADRALLEMAGLVGANRSGGSMA